MAETPPALMEMDGLTAPRLAFLFHAGLWLPAPHESTPCPWQEVLFSLLRNKKHDPSGTVQAAKRFTIRLR